MSDNTTADYCAICREEDSPCDFITGCGHCFHFECLWSNRYSKMITKECPYCRQSISNFTEKERLLYNMKRLKFDANKTHGITNFLSNYMNYKYSTAYAYNLNETRIVLAKVATFSYGEKMMEDLKQIGWNINSSAEGGLNLLIQVCEKDDLYRLNLLIDYGLKLDPGSAYENEATKAALNNSSFLVLQKIIIEKSNSMAHQYEAINFENYGDQLIDACQGNNFERVKALIKEGADVDFRDHRGSRPIHKACSFANIKIIDYLIEMGAEINCVDLSGKSPLHEACASKYNRKDVVKKLLEKNANVSYLDQDQNTQLHLAIICRKYEIAEMLIDYYENVELLNIFNESPLHLAADFAPKSLIEKLISRGSDLNAVDYKGRSPLHRAVALNTVKVVDHLLLNGADVNQVDKNNTTAFLLATKREPASPFVSSLIKYGADLNSKNSSGKTALEAYIELHN